MKKSKCQAFYKLICVLSPPWWLYIVLQGTVELQQGSSRYYCMINTFIPSHTGRVCSHGWGRQKDKKKLFSNPLFFYTTSLSWKPVASERYANSFVTASQENAPSCLVFVLRVSETHLIVNII